MAFKIGKEDTMYPKSETLLVTLEESWDFSGVHTSSGQMSLDHMDSTG